MKNYKLEVLKYRLTELSWYICLRQFGIDIHNWMLKILVGTKVVGINLDINDGVIEINKKNSFFYKCHFRNTAEMNVSVKK